MPLHDLSDPGLPGIEYVGYNQVGGSTHTNSASTLHYIQKKIVLASPRFLASIDTYATCDANHVSTLYAGVQGDAGGSPGAQILSMGNFHGPKTADVAGYTLNFDAPSSTGWTSVPVCVALPAGTYWLHVAWGGSGNAAAMTVYYDAGSDLTGTDNNSWFNAGLVGSNSSRSYSVRGTVLG